MELLAPSSWRCADFLSDLHLQSSDRATFETWAAWLHGTKADAIFILGDLFEVWVGDDAALVDGSFEAECVAVLRQTAQRTALFIMQGNRDFLMGSALMQACKATLLPDPTVLDFAGQRWLLSHGDALCLDDHDYQAFRRQVRSPAWQQAFLAKPLAERQAIALGIRKESAARRQTAEVYADVDTAAALALLTENRATELIHGHTHKPARHALSNGLWRTVLSDWDLNALPARAEVLRIAVSAENAKKTGTTGSTATVTRLQVAAIAKPAG